MKSKEIDSETEKIINEYLEKAIVYLSQYSYERLPETTQKLVKRISFVMIPERWQ